jgi:hypothetical protein
MDRSLVAAAVLALAGCQSEGYLDPAGPGEARTVGGICPVVYRVLDIPVPNSDARIYLNAFGKNEVAREAAIFLVVSDSGVFINNVWRGDPHPQRHVHKISFPDGMTLQVTFDDGRTVSGELATVSDGARGTTALILKLVLPDREVSRFSVVFPSVMVDGERVGIGRVDFKPARATIYGINC